MKGAAGQPDRRPVASGGNTGYESVSTPSGVDGHRGLPPAAVSDFLRCLDGLGGCWPGCPGTLNTPLPPRLPCRTPGVVAHQPQLLVQDCVLYPPGRQPRTARTYLAGGVGPEADSQPSTAAPLNFPAVGPAAVRPSSPWKRAGWGRVPARSRYLNAHGADDPLSWLLFAIPSVPHRRLPGADCFPRVPGSPSTPGTGCSMANSIGGCWCWASCSPPPGRKGEPHPRHLAGTVIPGGAVLGLRLLYVRGHQRSVYNLSFLKGALS